MAQYFNRKISTPIAIAIILVSMVISSGTIFWQYSEMQREVNIDYSIIK